MGKCVPFCCTLGVVWVNVQDVLNLYSMIKNHCIRKTMLSGDCSLSAIYHNMSAYINNIFKLQKNKYIEIHPNYKKLQIKYLWEYFFVDNYVKTNENRKFLIPTYKILIAEKEQKYFLNYIAYIKNVNNMNIR